MIQKSPGGSTFPYFYKGGEIHCLKYGSFFADDDRLLAVMQAEEEFIENQNRRLRIWVDFYETQWTDRLLLEFLRSIKRIHPHIMKLAIVGCSFRDRRRLSQLGKQADVDFSIPVKFFRDPEKAKSWLVRETV